MRLTFLLTCLIAVYSILPAAAQSAYPNFPEKFDTEQIKDEYDDGDVQLKSGLWRLKGVKLVHKKKGVEIAPDGTKALQFISNNKGPMVAQMKFDLKEGASKVIVTYASYGDDASCKWTLEASTDGGKKWKQIGEEVLVENKQPKTEELAVNLRGNVRFRIVKMPLGNPKDNPEIKNGRLVVDDIIIYKHN